jgi:hypothetical protein
MDESPHGLGQESIHDCHLYRSFAFSIRDDLKNEQLQQPEFIQGEKYLLHEEIVFI